MIQERTDYYLKVCERLRRLLGKRGIDYQYLLTKNGTRFAKAIIAMEDKPLKEKDFNLLLHTLHISAEGVTDMTKVRNISEDDSIRKVVLRMLDETLDVDGALKKAGMTSKMYIKLMSGVNLAVDRLLY